MSGGYTVLVTGASRGIGHSVAKVLLDDFEGLNVVAYSRSETGALQSLAKVYTEADNALFFHGDVTKDADNKEAIDTTIRAYGRLDAIVHCAGVLDPLGRIADLDVEKVREHLDVNVISGFSLVKHALPYLRKAKQPKIILITSGAATSSYSAWSPYSAGKAALESFGRSLAKEEPDVISLCFSPGPVDTGMQETLRTKGEELGMDASDVKKFVDLHSSGKLPSSDMVGSVIASIAVHGDSSLTGKVVKWTDDELKKYRAPPASQ